MLIPVEDDTTAVGCGNAECPCKATAILIRQKLGGDVDAAARARRRRIVELVAARRHARAAR